MLATLTAIGGCVDRYTDDEGRTLLQATASAGMERLVCALIGKSGDVNARDEYGETPLTFAARSGMVGVMEALVAMGADVECGRYTTPWTATRRRLHSSSSNGTRPAT